ncbi:hypothetical protein BB559_005355 [Furculomyces boomerangus]|uniref:Hydroxysteroid dehydrogenase-like protein 2 n=2 Tax=Harpellales TaxID=61421 RepID=A0A2T9Y965_9FUNG|nr:hypothetical protein BB559_005355 [Furculomyces boomerangus]PWA01144.1 hypothetical protein BB558_002772 [Smittium angustum]
MSASLKGKVLFITGASRGIGKEIALRAARDGAKIAIVAKTVEPHPKLPGTIYTAADEIRKAGGSALPIQCDIRFEAEVQNAIDQTVKEFGGIDIVINNASAINTNNTENTPVSRYDLMHQINTRGTWLVSKLAIPHLKKASNPHILNISPPLSMEQRWFEKHVAYTMAKYGMSMCVLGMSGELKKYGIGVNALWPYTTIRTAALQLLDGGRPGFVARTPEIMSDSAHLILTSDSKTTNGNFFLDELYLREKGFTDFDKYSEVPGTKLEDIAPDFFLDADQVKRLLELRKIQSKL